MGNIPSLERPSQITVILAFSFIFLLHGSYYFNTRPGKIKDRQNTQVKQVFLFFSKVIKKLVVLAVM